MQTYVEKKPFVDNPDFVQQRKDAIGGIDYNYIDDPVVGLISNIAKIPYCFSLQSCCGHFVYLYNRDIHDYGPLKKIDGILEVDYRIAYLALCIDNCTEGKELLSYLERVVEIDKDYIQFGCADWFWERQVNSYVLQVQPKRFKHKDRMFVEIQEAYHIEFIKRRFFGMLNLIINCGLKK